MRFNLFLAIFILGLFVFCSISVLAQEELPNSGILPDNPFYMFKRFGERIRFWLTFDPEAKIRLRIQLAEMRLAELNATMAKGHPRRVQFDLRGGPLPMQPIEGGRRERICDEVSQAGSDVE